MDDPEDDALQHQHTEPEPAAGLEGGLGEVRDRPHGSIPKQGVLRCRLSLVEKEEGLDKKWCAGGGCTINKRYETSPDRTSLQPTETVRAHHSSDSI